MYFHLAPILAAQKTAPTRKPLRVFAFWKRDLYGQNVSEGHMMTTVYDATGNRTQLKTAKQEVNYSFDELNRLSEVVTSTNAANVGWAGNQKATYQYDEVGNRKGMVNPNGTAVSYGFDVRNRLKTLVQRAGTAASAAVLLSLSYTVDASGLRTQIAETRPGAIVAAQPITRTSAFAYDQVKRLTRESISSNLSQFRQSAWSYDRVGNRLSEITSGTINKNVRYIYDANDRLSKETDSSNNTLADYVYDQNGNTVQKKLGANVLASYRWDEENRMVGATIGAKVISYAYDPSGIRRAQEEVEGTVRKRTEYLVDANQSYAQVVEEWGANGVAASSLADEVLGKTYVFGDDLISQTKVALDGTGTNHFYHYDGLGTTRALSNTAGLITDRNAYTAFGENDPAGTSGNTSGTTDNNFKYTGEQLDPNLGFYYLRARYMNPSTGAFVSQDSYMGSSQDPASLHKYLYANANPVMGIDPSGNFVTLAEIGSAFTIQAILTNAAVGGVLGAIDAALSNGERSIVDGAFGGALMGAAIGPFGLVKSIAKPVAALFGVIGVGGAVSSVSNGNYAQAAFRGVTGLLSAYLIFRASLVPSGNYPDGYISGQYYSGVWNSRQGIAVEQSGTASVPRAGGHRLIADKYFPGANPRHLFAFTLRFDGSRFHIGFNSRSVNGENSSFEGNVAPPEFHGSIAASVQRSTSIEVLPE